MERKATKRRRAALACDQCRRKKIRCDSARPSCDNCSHTRLKCSYTEPRQRRRPTGTRKLDTASRLDRIESLLYAIAKQKGMPLRNYSEAGEDSENSDESDGDGDEQDDSLSEVESDEPSKMFCDNSNMLKVAHNEDSHLYTHAITGTFLSQGSLKWLETKINDPPLFERLRLSIQGLFLHQQHRINMYTENILNVLSIDLEFMRAALRFYMQTVMPFCSVLLTPREAEELSKAKWETLSLANRLMACSVTTLMGFWMAREEIQTDLKYSPEYLLRQSTLFMSHAGKYAQTLSLAVPNMSMIRAYAVFVMALDKVQMPPASVFYTMLMMNLAIAMGMNRTESYRGMSDEARDRRKATWWVVYVFERDMSIKMGRAPMVPDSEISTETIDGSELNAPSGSVRYFIQLARIYGKVYRKLFSVAAQSRTRSQKFQDVIALSNELESWRQHLPVTLQLDEAGDFVTPSNSVYDVTTKKIVIWLHASFYEVVTTVHRIAAFSPGTVQAFLKRQQDPTRTAQNSPNGSNGANAAVGPVGVTPVDSPMVSESDAARLLAGMDICRDAARKMLRCADHFLVIGCGAIVSSALMFVTSAFITLFGSIMIEPTTPQSVSDRELMRRYLPLFAAQKFDGATESHPITAFWSIMVEVLDRYYEKQTNMPEGSASEVPANVAGRSLTAQSAAKSEFSEPAYGLAELAGAPAPPGPSMTGEYFQDSLFLDPQVDGSINWMMRDSFDGLQQQYPGADDSFAGNFGELANDMYMMSGFYGT